MKEKLLAGTIGFISLTTFVSAHAGIASQEVCLLVLVGCVVTLVILQRGR